MALQAAVNPGRGRNLDEPGVKELRFGLVCYGGVSLAVYMHGLTKELHNLVRASEALHRDPDHAFDPSTTEHAFAEALRLRAERDQVKTRVVVDVIAGTSAGGINGVCLAKAIANDADESMVRDLWIERAGISQLVGRRPWLPFAVYRLLFRSERGVMRGETMLGWIHDALCAMDDTTEPGRTLMPPGHDLDLFVTTTDLGGYGRCFPLEKPAMLGDRTHRHVFRFRRGARQGAGSEDRFSRDANHALAFAARATSSFPGAFAPQTIDDAARVYAKPAAGRPAFDRARFAAEHFRLYELSGANPAESAFVDGAVLDNKPFGYAIEAIIARPAATQVERKLLFIDPDPSVAAITQPNVRGAGFARVLLGSVVSVPRHEPILDDVVNTQLFNDRVGRVRDIIESQWENVAGQLREVKDDAVAKMAADESPAAPSERRAEMTKTVQDDLHQRAAEILGPWYRSYVRTKLRATVDGYASASAALCGYPSESNQSRFVSAALEYWARCFRGYLPFSATCPPGETLPDPGGELPNPDQLALLKDFDLGYRRRRVRFTVGGINRLYPAPGDPPLDPDLRASYDAAKRALYDHRDEIDAAELEASATMAGAVQALFARSAIDPLLFGGMPVVAAFVADNAAVIESSRETVGAALRARLDDFNDRVRKTLELHSITWPAEAREAVQVRFEAFPIWDALVFPLRELADVGELDEIQMVRLSPVEATLIPTPKGKLMGSAIHHFGAFFDRGARENDYLWGRADMVEQLLRLLLGDSPEVPRLARNAFAAIATQERAAMQTKAGQALLEKLAAF